MCSKRCLLATIAVFISVFLFEFLVHGLALSGIYKQSPEMWRPEDVGGSYMCFMFIGQLAFAAAAVLLFSKNYENKGIKEGVNFGLYLGLLLAALEIPKYSYMPITMGLMLAWVASSFVKGMITGVVSAAVYKKS